MLGAEFKTHQKLANEMVEPTKGRMGSVALGACLAPTQVLFRALTATLGCTLEPYVACDGVLTYHMLCLRGCLTQDVVKYRVDRCYCYSKLCSAAENSDPRCFRASHT